MKVIIVLPPHISHISDIYFLQNHQRWNYSTATIQDNLVHRSKQKDFNLENRKNQENVWIKQKGGWSDIFFDARLHTFGTQAVQMQYMYFFLFFSIQDILNHSGLCCNVLDKLTISGLSQTTLDHLKPSWNISAVSSKNI